MKTPKTKQQNALSFPKQFQPLYLPKFVHLPIKEAPFTNCALSLDLPFPYFRLGTKFLETNCKLRSLPMITAGTISAFARILLQRSCRAKAKRRRVNISIFLAFQPCPQGNNMVPA